MRRGGSRLLPALAATLVLTACAGAPPPPDWQMNAKGSLDRAAEAYLSGNSRREALEFARARAELARTGRADLLARSELLRCATRVASLEMGACSAYEALAADAAPPEQAYARYLSGQVEPADVALLPKAQQGLAANPAAPDAALAVEAFAKETLPISLEDEMRRSYLDYAMSVIVGRACRMRVMASSRCIDACCLPCTSCRTTGTSLQEIGAYRR
jgi:hypothetical protein